jgi:uncharacterized protein (TIGR00290 family)
MAVAKKTAVVLWTGGKDSFLALELASENFLVTALATFIPASGADFHAHPRGEMSALAESLGLELHFIPVAEPFRDSYVQGLRWIRESLGAGAVVTGDIDRVDGLPNWIEECCKDLDLEVAMPLWGRDRAWILEQLLARGIRARITWINDARLPQSWIEREIDAALVAEMKRQTQHTPFDLAGENGEYHSMVFALSR